MPTPNKVVITGAGGLVGQNLIPRLTAAGFAGITAIDKHPANTRILRRQHPSVKVLERDLAGPEDDWQAELAGCDVLVVGHAQIGGLVAEEYTRNNVVATERLMKAALRHRVPYLVNISSSVVNSLARDNYTETKKAQEALVAATGIPQVILRPTLMFGWFDRKHVGWLARFMQRAPVFPIPGTGRFLRQPLFARDFCDVIVAAIARETTGTYNITGQDRIDYIDLIRAVKAAVSARAHIIRVPFGLFRTMLQVNAVFDKNPAFTVKQLEALATPDIFEVIDWPGIFGVSSTPLDQALAITFRDPVYSNIVLDF